MSQTVITIVGTEGALDETAQGRAVALVKGLGVEGIDVQALAPRTAIDVIAAGNAPALEAALRAGFASFGPFDIFVQRADAHRKKRLLVADMDATMIEGETLDELAAHFGLKDRIAPITAKAMNGEIDFAEALRLRVGLLKGLPVSALHETLKEVRFSKGARTLVKTMNRHGARCVLISGGFDIFTSHVAGALGFQKNIGNRLGIADDRLTGEVLPPIVDKNTKKQTVEEEARLLQADLQAVAAVGDGANDIPMLQAAGAGIGYFAKPAVQAATPHQIRYTDLTAILYMQGYGQRDFAG
jgi:phosphoserine phosphatase